MVDSNTNVGGNMISMNEDGYTWEEGPNSFTPSAPILRLMSDIGLIDELVLADMKGKLRAALGLLGVIKAKPKGDYEESIQEFATRHLGAEVFERVVDPFVSGVYAGDPRRLSISAALRKVKALEDLGGSRGLISGAFVKLRQAKRAKLLDPLKDADLPAVPKGSLGSLQRGMQSIPKKISELLGPDRVLLSHTLVSVARDGRDFVCEFKVGESGDTKIIRSRSLVLTCPAHVTAALLGGDRGLLPHSARLLEGISYPPVAVVVSAYPNQAFKVETPLVGFGHLIPRLNRIRTLGCIWVSSLFPNRAPAGFTLLNSFVGGAQDPSIDQLSTVQIADIVHNDHLNTILKPDAQPPRVLAVKLWRKAIPQFEIGHLQRISEIRRACLEHPGLFLGGNYLSGVAIGDCVESGKDGATEVVKYLTAAAAASAKEQEL
eukprot:gene21310-27340_t